MHEIISEEGNVIRIRVSGKLTEEDYDQLIPAWQRVIASQGSMRMLLLMEDFHGWEPGAAWDDFRFEMSHARKIERVAMVGEKAWQKWMIKIGEIFASDQVKYFDVAQLAAAEGWIAA